MLELKTRDGERDVVLRFEHSLHSLSKWESKHRVPFLASTEKPAVEMIDYYGDMLLPPEVDSTLVYSLSPEQLEALKNYINTPQTASSVPKDPQTRPSTEIVTSELMYYWMVALKINWEAQHWHLSRLTMLVEITGFKQQPEKKGRPGSLKSWREANAKRKQQFGSSG